MQRNRVSAKIGSEEKEEKAGYFYAASSCQSERNEKKNGEFFENGKNGEADDVGGVLVNNSKLNRGSPREQR